MTERGDILVLRRTGAGNQEELEMLVTSGSDGIYELSPVTHPTHSELFIGDDNLYYIGNNYYRLIEVKRGAGKNILQSNKRRR